ncbi:MAG TPA: outer membrane beta-barrel protein [Gemmatimonadales bacterium]|nr:outer membrane beta-barrel protein [Gemmatimonadales bacterium]
MLRHARTACLAAALAATAPALASAQGGIAFTGGVSMASLDGDIFGTSESRTGWLAGVTLDFGVVQPSILYHSKGAKLIDEGFLDASLALDYVQVPVLVSYGVPVNDRIRLVLGAGPSVGLRVRCAIGASFSGFGGSTDCGGLEDDETGDGISPKRVEVSGVGRIGLEFSKITVMLRGELGFTNAFDVTGEGITFTPDVKSRAISIVAVLRP